MSIPRRFWTDLELDRLCEEAPRRTVRELAELLGRHEGSVKSKLTALGISARPANHAWTVTQVRTLRERWPDVSLSRADIAAEIGVTPKQAKGMAGALGLKRDFAARARTMRAWYMSGMRCAEIAARLDLSVAAVQSAFRKHCPGTLTNRRAWTPQQDKLLREMRLAGACYRRIAAALGRTKSAVSKRLQQRHGDLVHGRRSLSPAEGRQVRAALLAGESVVAISGRLGRSRTAVDNYARRHNLARRVPARRHYERWTPADLVNLRIRAADGWSARQISEDLERTEAAVSVKLSELRRQNDLSPGATVYPDYAAEAVAS